MESNVFAPPKSEPSEEIKNEDRNVTLGKVCALISILMMFSLYGFMSAIWQLFEVFQNITLTGTGDPKVMAGNISQALVPTVTSLFFSVPAILFALFSIYFSSYRSSTIYKLWSLSAVVLVISFPFGTAFGFLFGLILFFKRNQFKKVT
ncbi:MotA/TolQ/ExbB proton channel family protein [Thalassotalea litorea]|uniref:MotA/TolQ/ExbB proton channel family protein n=1 Tax=Thalassotalea litorea TaxID=2020715 RepID=A0A5R9IER0_9GAMM|nr:MotA/TolQ/ExbB proton channel family protein [Thalassotalea litorea]TLU61090.1 MotA/TolQ/ExbB proton channel family protein [Thalassotalea litorea]